MQWVKCLASTDTLPSNSELYWTSKLHACLIDRAIMIPPDLLEANLYNSEAYDHGVSKYENNRLPLKDVLDINLQLWENPAHKEVMAGFVGIGITEEKGRFFVVIYCDQRAYQHLSSTALQINNRYRLSIFCDPISKPQFANSSFCPGGSCIKNSAGTIKGILTGWFLEQKKYGNIIGITNNHVAVEFGVRKIGTAILNEYDHKIGEVLDAWPLKEYHFTKLEESTNRIDLAWINPITPKVVDHSVNCCSSSDSRPVGDVILEKSFVIGEKDVILCGEPIERGTIEAIMPSYYIEFSGKSYRFRDILKITPGGLGQSGSLILDPNDKVGGIFFASDPDGKNGYLFPWQSIKLETGLDLLI